MDAPQNDNPDAELIARVDLYLTELEKDARLMSAAGDIILGSPGYAGAERAITENWERVTRLQDWITAYRAHGPAGWRAKAQAIRASYDHIDAWNEAIVMSLVDDLLR